MRAIVCRPWSGGFPTALSRSRLVGGAVATATGLWLLIAVAPAGAQSRNAAPSVPPPSGAEIYQSRCIACHGATGEGSKENPERLEGSKGVGQLADVIRRTMPQDDAGSLSAEQAAAVAAYIHDAFYSPIARERLRPARISLARLTVSQYRDALGDLVGSFRETPTWGAERGLRGEYFSGRRLGGRNQRAAERIDREIAFDFGRDAPVPQIAEPHEFSIRWTGSLLAPDTGEYEFVIRTEHAARLWVNETRQPLIDAWVKSGSDTEYRGSIVLNGGRVYPLKMEFTKSKQGVDDSAKQKAKPASAPTSVALLWRRPHRAAEPVPSRHLSPRGAPERFVCTTAFPPDDRSYGWERATTISTEWDQATTEGALEAAKYVVRAANELAGTKEGAADRREKLLAFCRRFAERAFRQPLEDDVAQSLIGGPFEAADDPNEALEVAAWLVLKSPRFLYRELGSADGYRVASRLSFGLWNTLPDLALLNAARDGRLATKEQVAQQAERMLADPRAAARLRAFLLTWLKADADADLAKDSQAFPGFDGAVISDLRTSLELFLDDIVESERADFRRLFLNETLPLNERLMEFYGVELPARAELPGPRSLSDSTFRDVRLDDGKRAGVLTHPYLMARHAYHRETSPIHRGVFVLRGVLGQTLRPPPDAVVPIPPDLHPTLTTRERVVLQTKGASCSSCHSAINPLGFPLERLDAVGRWRDTDRGKPIDDSGSYLTRNGERASFAGARGLAAFLGESDEAHGAFVEQLFHHLVQQPIRAYGPATREALEESFRAGELNIRRLAVEIMAASALTGRESTVGVANDSK